MLISACFKTDTLIGELSNFIEIYCIKYPVVSILSKVLFSVDWILIRVLVNANITCNTNADNCPFFAYQVYREHVKIKIFKKALKITKQSIQYSQVLYIYMLFFFSEFS